MACPLCGELCTCAADRGSSSARAGEETTPHVAVLIDPESLGGNGANGANGANSAGEPSEPRVEAHIERTLEPEPEPEPEFEDSVVEVPLDEVAEVLASVEVAAPLVEAEAQAAERTRAAVAVSEPPRASSAPPSAGGHGPYYRAEESSAWRQEVSSRVDNFRTRRRGRYDPNSSLSLNFDTAFDESQPQMAAPQVQVNEAPKIIEFPKPAPVVEELAEPVVEKPRILEAEEPPEEAVPAGGMAAPPIASITLEPPATETVRAYGQDQEVLLWIAPPAQRIFAGLVDALIVATATGLFGLIFLHMTGAAPSWRMAAGFALALPGFFWALYQYIFLVYGGTTPGLQMTGLRLTTFDGHPVPRSLRRWRALAMIVSYVSLGLGFLWAILDEDGLCWHDRITRTCVRE